MDHFDGITHRSMTEPSVAAMFAGDPFRMLGKAAFREDDIAVADSIDESDH
ncbi:MAG: hypothetical protein JNL96_10880 [Planctomycetaceae bacterium]|nr:hypothetical protein [Planctomycetaceae bacterium]